MRKQIYVQDPDSRIDLILSKGTDLNNSYQLESYFLNLNQIPDIDLEKDTVHSREID